jgi:hypothetical protein
MQLLRVTIASPVNKVVNNRVAVFSNLIWLDEKHQFLVIVALTGQLTLLRGA